MVEEVGSSAMTVDTEVEVEVVVDGIELLEVVVVEGGVDVVEAVELVCALWVCLENSTVLLVQSVDSRLSTVVPLGVEELVVLDAMGGSLVGW